MITQKQLAERLQCEENRLEIWRMRGEGPPYIKLGTAKNSHIRYKLDDIEAWENSLPRITPIAQKVDAAYQRRVSQQRKTA